MPNFSLLKKAFPGHFEHRVRVSRLGEVIADGSPHAELMSPNRTYLNAYPSYSSSRYACPKMLFNMHIHTITQGNSSFCMSNNFISMTGLILLFTSIQNLNCSQWHFVSQHWKKETCCSQFVYCRIHKLQCITTTTSQFEPGWHFSSICRDLSYTKSAQRLLGTCASTPHEKCRSFKRWSARLLLTWTGWVSRPTSSWHCLWGKRKVNDLVTW